MLTALHAEPVETRAANPSAVGDNSADIPNLVGAAIAFAVPNGMAHYRVVHQAMSMGGRSTPGGFVRLVPMHVTNGLAALVEANGRVIPTSLAVKALVQRNSVTGSAFAV